MYFLYFYYITFVDVALDGIPGYCMTLKAFHDDATW